MPDLFVADENKKTTEATVTSVASPVAPKNPRLAKVSQPNTPSRFSLFTTYAPNPTNITFQNQEAQESILLIIRHHIITTVPWLFVAMLLSVLPFFFFLLLEVIPLSLFTIPQSFITVLLLFYYLLIYSYVFTHVLKWFYNMGIITPLRVVDIDIVNIINKEISTTNIDDVVDASYVQRGFFQNFFNFGDVLVQTEGVKANFEFRAAPKPADVSDLILDLKEGSKQDV